MKSLQLPKNKFLRLLINIIFIIGWYIFACQIKWQLNSLTFFPYIIRWEFGCDPSGGGGLPYEICGFSSVIYHIITFPIPIFLGTRYIWFEKSRNRIFYGLFEKFKSFQPRIYTTTSNADELKKYSDLKDQGIITDKEFQAKKKKLLDL